MKASTNPSRRRPCGRKRFGEVGSALVTVLMVAAMGATIVAGAAYWTTRQLELRQVSNLSVNVAFIRETVFKRIDNDQAWRASLEKMATIDPATKAGCFLVNGADCSGAAGALRLYGADGTRVLDPSTNAGFTLDGAPCDAFNATDGNDDCPFRFNLNWSADCPAGGAPCTSEKAATDSFARRPRVLIWGSLEFKPGPPPDKPGRAPRFLPVNVANYVVDPAFRGERPASVSDMNRVCGSFNGTFDPATKTCSLPVDKIGTCPAYYAMNGVDPNTGKASCVPSEMIDVTCVPGTNSSAIVGVTPWGQFLCGKF